MTPEEKARLDAIHTALARMARRQDELERRLSRLENPGAEEAALPPAPPEPVPPPLASAPPEPAPPPAEVPPPRFYPEAPARRNIEVAFGLTWVSRIAVVTAALALAFFFQYAFERRWITETARVLLGCGVGLGALALGERFWRVRQTVYGQGLTAAGIAFLYLSIWAAFGLYHLIGQSAAFAGMALVTAAAVTLSLRYNALSAAAFGLTGGYATPLLLGASQGAWFVLGYALALDVGAAHLSRARRWRPLEALAVGGTLALYLSQMPVAQGAEWGYTAFVLAYYALFAVSEWMPVMGTAQVLAAITLSSIWFPAAGGILGAGLIAAAGLAVADRRAWPPAVIASFAGFWLGNIAWMGRGDASAALGPLIGAFTFSYLLFLGWPVWRAAVRRLPLEFPDLAVAAVNAALYFGTCYSLLESRHVRWAGLFTLAMAAAQMAAARLLWKCDRRGAMLATATAATLLALAAPIQFDGYRITIAWALEGAAAVWLGKRFGEKRAFLAAAAIFALAALRLIFADAPMYGSPADYSLFFNARLLAFAATAVALGASAWWIREGRLALAAYAGGHAALIAGLCLEAAGWAARTASPDNFRSVASTAISVLVAVYAVAMVAGGAAWRHAVTRVLGVILIGAVVVKLYLYDVWLLRPFYRMTAFAILGALLWVMAYLYSRRRATIGNWWRR